MKQITLELEKAITEKEKVEKELSQMNTEVNFIDQYKQEYDQVIASIKQLDNEFLLQNPSRNEEYQKKREELNQKKQYYTVLFEQQLQKEEEYPGKKKELEERLKALIFQMEELQKEIADERRVIGYHLNHNERVKNSMLSSIGDCKHFIEQTIKNIEKVWLETEI